MDIDRVDFLAQHNHVRANVTHAANMQKMVHSVCACMGNKCVCAGVGRRVGQTSRRLGRAMRVADAGRWRQPSTGRPIATSGVSDLVL
jgi:hypothetical protein